MSFCTEESLTTSRTTSGAPCTRCAKQSTQCWPKASGTSTSGEGPGVAWHSIKDDRRVSNLWNDVPVWARNVLESSYFSEVACMLARLGPKAIPGAIASVAHAVEA